MPAWPPLACDSGQMKGKRTVRGGRRSIRDILFVVAAGVRRHNPDFRAFRERLAAAGKAKKVIRIALAHKLLVRLNAKAREVRQLQGQHVLLLCFLKYSSRRSVGESGKRVAFLKWTVHAFSTTRPAFTRLTKQTVAPLRYAPVGMTRREQRLTNVCHHLVIPSAAEGSAVQRTFPGNAFHTA